VRPMLEVTVSVMVPIGLSRTEPALEEKTVI